MKLLSVLLAAVIPVAAVMPNQGVQPPKFHLKERLPVTSGKITCNKPNPSNTYPTSDYYNALNLLFESPQFWIAPDTARFALYGDSVVFICNKQGWNSGSLVEFMSVMDMLDIQCGEGQAGKRTLKGWGKDYGRGGRKQTICDSEKAEGGIKNEFEKVVKAGCQQYVSGQESFFGHAGTCRRDNAGPARFALLKERFPWYNKGMEISMEDLETAANVTREKVE